MTEDSPVELKEMVENPTEREVLEGQRRYALAKHIKSAGEDPDMWPGEIESAQVEAAIQMAEAGDVEPAKQLVAKIVSPYERVEFYVYLAKKEGRDSPAIQLAMNAAEEIDDQENKLGCVLQIARIQGKDSPAWEEAQKIVDSADQQQADEFNKFMTHARADIGDIEKAMEAAAKIKWVEERIYTYMAIGRRDGPNSEAWEKAYQDTYYVDEHDQANVEAQLAVMMARVGNTERARQIADDIKDSEERRDALHQIERLPVEDNDWVQPKKTGEYRGEPDSKEIYEAIRDRDGSYLSIAKYIQRRPEDEDNPAALKNPIHRARYVGASAIEHWKKFKELDIDSFARLAHGAAEVAHAYMSEEERREFVRALAEEFRQFNKKGMFKNGKNQAVLKNLSEAMAELDDPAATGNLLEAMTQNMGDSVGLRLMKTLLESGNAKAGASGISVLCKSETPDQVYNYLLHKLAQTNYIDSELPNMIYQEDALGRFPQWASRTTLQHFNSELGIQLDSDLLHWVISHVSFEGFEEDYYNGVKTKAAADFLADGLAEITQVVKESVNKFDGYDQAELLDALSSDEEMRALYFMLKGGRTRYALIQHYNLGKFSAAVSKGREIQQNIDLDLVDRELWKNAPEGWLEAMIGRRRPSEDLVWQCEVGSSSKELRESARRDIHSTLGVEMSWLLRGGIRESNFADFAHIEHYETLEAELRDRNPEGTQPADSKNLEFLFGEKQGKKLANILGPAVSSAISGEQLAGIGDFEKAKAAVLAQLRQLRKNAKQNPRLADEWKAIIDRAEQEDPVIAMRHILSVMANNPELSNHPKGAVNEWIGHLHGLASSVREAQVKSSEQRQITIRYLDGKEDFAELLRFADGAQCCFTSEQTITDGEMDPGGNWRMRINRDPHWFVFSIEDTAPDEARRSSTGFVFGSLARVDGKPVLAINGIYMQRKTDAAANTVVNQIAERFAKPLGVEQILLAAVHGGQFQPDTARWQPAGGRSLHRPRAIRIRDSYNYPYDDYGDQRELGDAGQPETITYDDLGEGVNTDTVVPEYCWIRTL